MDWYRSRNRDEGMHGWRDKGWMKGKDGGMKGISTCRERRGKGDREVGKRENYIAWCEEGWIREGGNIKEKGRLGGTENIKAV